MPRKALSLRRVRDFPPEVERPGVSQTEPALSSLLFHGVPYSVFGAADRVFDFALRLVRLAFGLKLSVADDPAGNVLHSALGLVAPGGSEAPAKVFYFVSACQSLLSCR
jgi:hypothetical protein